MKEVTFLDDCCCYAPRRINSKWHSYSQTFPSDSKAIYLCLVELSDGGNPYYTFKALKFDTIERKWVSYTAYNEGIVRAWTEAQSFAEDIINEVL